MLGSIDGILEYFSRTLEVLTRFRENDFLVVSDAVRVIFSLGVHT